ncbi:MAG: phosphomannomutase/phosphoglucomutase [Pseudomonadota bacterium]
MAERKSKNEILTFGIVPFGGILGAFVLASLTSLVLLSLSINGEHRERLAAQAAKAVKFQLDQRESTLLKQMQGAATSILLTQLVTSDDETARRLEESRLRELIPFAIKVKLIPLGTAQVDRNSNPPFSFTSKDLVNRVEGGLPVHAEAIDAGGNWVLSVAAPIRTPSEETVRGTLFVYLDMASLSSGLGDLVDGQLKLLQAFGNSDSRAILDIGASTSDEETITLALNNPNWSITFYPSDEIAGAAVGSLVDFLLPELVFLLIALGATFLGIRNLLGQIKDDVDTMANQITDVIKGEYEPHGGYGIAAFVELDANLGRLGKKQETRAPVEKLNVTLRPKEASASEMVDIEMIDEDEYEAALTGQSGRQETPPAAPEPASEPDVAEIFRAYDIRGLVNETLTPDVIKRIGLAIGTEAQEVGERTLIVGYDGRVSSPTVSTALIEGLVESGCDVINIGMVATPLVYFATHNSDARSGVMVTASHNPPDYNGFKIVFDGRTLVEEDIQQIYQRYLSKDFAEGAGSTTEIDIRSDYIDAIADDVVVAQPLKIVLDCGNGVAGDVAPTLLEALGCDVLPLYCDVDGTFPNHHPDPMVPANLADLILTVKSEGADLGIALDGDGDRLVAVTSNGDIVWPDQLMLLFAKDVVSRNPGSDVVYDIKSTRHLNAVISSFGGRPVISRSGHSFIKAKMAETGAVLGGEMSGHICFAERWYGFDDGLYAAARLLEIVGAQTEGLAELLAEFPTSVSTPEIHIQVTEATKFKIVKALVQTANFPDGTVTTIDGLRVDFAQGWGLVRASNTSPSLTLRFEADDQPALNAIEEMFREHLVAIDESLDF